LEREWFLRCVRFFRPRAYGEFNDAIVITNRPLGDEELFEVLVEQTVDRWSGSIEVGKISTTAFFLSKKCVYRVLATLCC
jgi:hypothetical protein